MNNWKFCPQCGKELVAAASFCHGCGLAVGTLPQIVPMPYPFYVPQQQWWINPYRITWGTATTINTAKSFADLDGLPPWA